MAKSKNEAKIKFIAETGEFNEQISSADNSLKELRSELKLNSAQMKTTGDSAETLKDRQKILARELDASRQKTDALTEKVEAAKRIYGENSDEVKKYQTQLNNAKSAEEKIQAEIEDTNKKLKEQKTAFDNVSEKADKFGEKLTNAGKKMSVVSAGIVGAGAASVAAFNEVDEGADNAIKATGATGKAAENLETAYKNVASSIVGDFGDLGSALGEVNTRFGFTGQTLETATTDFVKFSQVTGMDVTTAVQKVSRYMGDAGIDSSEYASVLDNLTVAAQASGVSMDTLTENLTKYGAPMRALGFETEESIAIFSSWEKAGVNTEIAFSGMKKAIGTWSKEGKDSRVEFKKTLKEIADCPDIASATTKAIEVFGQKAGPDLADAIKGGRFEYEDMLAVIEGSEGSLDGTFDATVDGGYEMELAMQNAKVALAEVGDTLSTSLAPIVESVTQGLKDFAAWWGNLDSGTQQTIITIAAVVAAIGPLLIIFGQVAGAISKISQAMKLAKGAITVVKTAMSGLNLTFLSSPIFWIIAAIVALVAAFVILWNNCDGFRQFWIDLWENIKSACSAAWEAIKNAFSTAWEWCKNVWKSAVQWFKNVWNGIQNVFANVGSWFKNQFEQGKKNALQAWSNVKNFFSNVWNGIKNVFANVRAWFAEKFNAAKRGIQTAWASVKNFFSNVWSGVKNVFANVGGWFKSKFTTAKNGVLNVWETVKSKFVNIKNGIVNAFSNVKEKLTAPFTRARDTIKGIADKIKGFFKGDISMPKIKLPHFSISPSGWKVGDLLKGVKPKLGIKWYADGGIFTKPTIFDTPYGLKGVGEAGAEAVLPIDRLQGYISDAINRNVQTANLQGLAQSIEDLADRPIILKINDREFAQATAGASDSVNGLRNIFKNRGLAID